jgi:CheY-like chemotaxis protein/two-component sensor histidine kinase
LLDLINSILDLAKVEAGKIELELSRVSIAELIRHCLMMIREKTIRRSLSLELTIENGLKNLAIQADELKLKQILYNLLSNAAKFTPEGGAISIVASKQGNEILVSVSDTGVGIKPEDQGRIFEIFEQADPSYARRVRGTGLGLALTRSLVQLHGGRIWAESEGEGQGSTFHFVIPMVEANALVIVDESETPFERSSNRWGSRWQQALETQSQPTVLVVEDDEINLHFTTVLLQRAGCRVLQAANAEDSIRVAKSQKPDLILMDVQLPSMDGLTATRILKQSPETASIPVVVVTACAMPGDEQECLAAGCATYIPKPIDSKRLRTVLRELLRTEESG